MNWPITGGKDLCATMVVTNRGRVNAARNWLAGQFEPLKTNEDRTCPEANVSPSGSTNISFAVEERPFRAAFSTLCERPLGPVAPRWLKPRLFQSTTRRLKRRSSTGLSTPSPGFFGTARPFENCEFWHPASPRISPT